MTRSCSLDAIAADQDSSGRADRARDCLARLIAGELLGLPIESVALSLAERRPIEYHAVSRALGCRDLFVLDSADRTARERIVADVASAASAVERVLILSPDPAAADRLANAIGREGAVHVVRALAEDENPLRPLPSVNRLTSSSAGTGRVEEAKREAAAVLAKLEAERASAAAASAALAEIRPLAERIADLRRDAADLRARREAVEAEVLKEADQSPSCTVFGEGMDRWRADREIVCRPLAAERSSISALRADKEGTLAAERRRLDSATAKPGLLTRLLGLSRVQTDAAEMEGQIRDLEREAKDLSGREAAIQAELDAANGRFAAERDKRIAGEVAARRVPIDVRLATVTADLEQIVARFGERIGAIERAGIHQPVGSDGELASSIGPELDARSQLLQTQMREACERLEDLDRQRENLARRFLDEATIVVGTPGSLCHDPVFGPHPHSTPPEFGLLILDHAEELTEDDFLGLSILGERWLLAGDSTQIAQTLPSNGKISRGRSQRPSRSPETPFFTRLVSHLDGEPWSIECDRLVYRLVHLRADDRRSLICEPVIDHPEIELRVSGLDGEAVLAEIAFPFDTPVAEAKRFLFTQLGEVLLRPCGEFHWHQNSEYLLACWPVADMASSAEDWVELDGGVKEKIVGFGAEAFTAAVAFQIDRGWDRAKAEVWLERWMPRQHSRVALLPLEDTSRVNPRHAVALG